ncbi:hypothetical protein [Spiroplasma monobiae]|uniref:Uncharacterized protein n=1 Tax=Spiroplasma monobiae MQ-1 TaxID=1336748 RepID=A0A2K9LUY1_SPISQ|nr:hypothetical protein [Spiroplasma monobiae]AUM62731.1 hypothetical protein SMONO_v1c04820 [Spiroplasma monobiae MQ-1]
MYYILINDNSFYVVDNNHNVMGRFYLISDAFSYIQFLYRSCDQCSCYWNTNVQVPIYEHFLFGFCQHCYCCQMIIKNNAKVWIPSFNNNTNPSSPKVKEDFDSKNYKKKSDFENIKKESKPNNNLKENLDKLDNLTNKEKKISNPKVKKNILISLAILISLFVILALSIFMWINFTKVTQSNLISNNSIFMINDKDTEKRVKFNNKVSDLIVKDKNTPNSIDIKIELENKSIIFYLSSSSPIGNYYVNFYSNEFQLSKKLSITIIDPEEINLEQNKIELLLDYQNSNNKVVKYNKNIKELIVKDISGNKIDVSIDQNNNNIYLKPIEVGRAIITFDSLYAKKEEIMEVNITESKYEIDIPDSLELKIDEGQKEITIIEYSHAIRNLRVISNDNDVVKVEVYQEEKTIKFSALKKGSTNIVFEADNSLKTKTVSIEVIDEGYEINLSKKEINLELTNDVVSSETIEYNKSIKGLSIHSEVDPSLKVVINDEQKTIHIKATKIGTYNVEFSASNSKNNETLVIKVFDNRVDIELSESTLEFNIVNGQTVEKTINYNKKAKNLILKETAVDFIDINIVESKGEIKITALKKGETELIFKADNQKNEAVLKVKVNETTILDPVIEKVEDKTLFGVGDTNEFLVNVQNKIENETLKFKTTNEEIVKVTFDQDSSKMKIIALKQGNTSILLSYKNAKDIKFDVFVKDIIDISNFDKNLGFIEGFADKGSDSELNKEDLKVLIKGLFEKNNIKEEEYLVYMNDIQISNFHKIQGQKINRRFDITAKSDSKLIKGSLKDAFLRTSPLDLSDKENQIKSVGSIISSITDKKDLLDSNKVSKVILEQFISLNFDLNPIDIVNIEIEPGSATNFKNGTYTLTIKAKDNQNSVKSKTVYQFTGFYVNGISEYPDIESLFN